MFCVPLGNSAAADDSKSYGLHEDFILSRYRRRTTARVLAGGKFRLNLFNFRGNSKDGNLRDGVWVWRALSIKSELMLNEHQSSISRLNTSLLFASILGNITLDTSTRGFLCTKD